jgi:1-acyl-sn-glycerol-3-phosphate acyltransferase
MPFSPAIARTLARTLLDNSLIEHVQNLHYRDAGHGYDAFGLHPDYVSFGLGLTRWPYERYFRVISHGIENLPKDGSAILASNHSGNVPIDGMMLWHDVLRQTNPARVARGIADHFVPSLPFIGSLFARGGMVGGSRGNARTLLEAGELLMIFPEGVPGIIKPWSKRYQLQKFRVGHAELAIRHSTPIIPIGIIGAEEQMPSILSSKRLGKLFGIESVPIPILPVPLPVRYYIYYGEPIPVQQEYPPEAADDPSVLKAVATRVQESVAALIKQGLDQREGVFK